MKRPDYIIGIDPDIKKSGVTKLDTATKKLELNNLTLVELIAFLEELKAEIRETNKTLTIVIEGGWDVTRTHRRGKGETITAFSVTVENLESYVRRNQGCEIKEALNGTNHHYGSISSARSCIIRYIDSGVIKNINRKGSKLYYQEPKI